jgi:outer membrane protein assembly complex protein YaeT
MFPRNRQKYLSARGGIDKSISLLASLFLLMGLILAASVFNLHAQVMLDPRFENRPIAEISIKDERGVSDPATRSLIQEAIQREMGQTYSLVRTRAAIRAAYATGKIESVTVYVSEVPDGRLKIDFSVRKKSLVRRVLVNVKEHDGKTISPDEIQLRVDLVRPGMDITDESVNRNITSILVYLREKGYFDASVEGQIQRTAQATDATVVFTVNPKTQSRIRDLRIAINGADNDRLRRALKLKKGSLYSDEARGADVERLRRALQEQEFFVPTLEEPTLIRVGETEIDLLIEGLAGPRVEITVEAGREKVSSETLLKLLPVKRLGTLELSAIIEGKQRLERYFQEKGYFFAQVTPRCDVSILPDDLKDQGIPRNSEELCGFLSSLELQGLDVDIIYSTRLRISSRLVSIRFEGIEDFRVRGSQIFRIDEPEALTDGSAQFPEKELKALLQSREASLLGVLPYIGYGRGFTNSEILEEDEETLRNIFFELGYRDANVYHLQGTDITGAGLIITFVIEPGERTRVGKISFANNIEFGEDRLRAVLAAESSGSLEGRPFSSALVRTWTRRLSEFYSNQGFFNARVRSTISSEQNSENSIQVIFSIENEDSEVVTGNILVAGNENVSRESVVRSLDIRSGRLLRSADIFTSEQRLYETDVFRGVEIKTQSAGNDEKGRQIADVNVNLEEQPTRLITYGGGYSTDGGPFGSFDIRNLNFLEKLQQAGGRVRISRLQQLVQLDYLNPNFIRDGFKADDSRRFAPLTVTAQYQRDSTVTRFFRSALDRGTFGIVQRLDEDGEPVDQFGAPAGSPTINRFSLSAETSRTLSTRNRTVLFARYRYEDVRLFNIDSLLIRDILEPDAKTRISGPGISIVRDTRTNCRLRYRLEEIVTRGDTANRCRYNPSDPTSGDYLTADYNFSAPVLGSNIGFQRLQLSYTRYATPPQLRNTTFAGRVILGMAGIFSRKDRFRNSQAPELDGILPISERFFGGGSNSLRGFEFESAGPRLVLTPQGTFRDQDGNIINLTPFTIPFGGNGLFVANLEARIPLSESIRLVPFYDGGNVFRRVRDIWKSPDVTANPVDGNLNAKWTNTVGLGFRLKTPIGGELAIDYGYLLDPPKFLVPQQTGPDGVYRLRQGQFHFRFAQAF